jgi:hypothetical protein
VRAVLLPRSRLVRLIALLVGLAVVVAGACVGFESLDARVTRAAASASWRTYTVCLVGEPVGAGEHSVDRLRAIDLAAVASTDADRGGWPGRCARHATQLAQLLSLVARRDARWGDAADLARRVSTPVDASRVDPALVDALSDALSRLPLPAPEVSAPVDPAPPAGIAPAIARDALAPLGAPGSASTAVDEPLPGESLRLAWAGHPVRVCRFDAGLASARCLDARGIPDEAQVTPVASDDAAPTTLLRAVFTRDTPAGILRAEDGERVSDDWSAPAFLRRDGRVLTLAAVHGGSVLRRADEEVGLAVPGSSGPVAIAGDALLWVAGDRLEARTLDADDGLGPITDVGPLPPGDRSLSLCRTREALAVRVTAGNLAVTAFRVGPSWSTPIASPRADRPASLACHGRVATLTWIDGRTVAQIVCSPAGCSRATAALGPAWEGGDLERAVVDVGGHLLAVRHAVRPSALAPEPVEAIVARFGSMAELAAAPDRVLVADAVRGGVDPASVQAFARDDAAVLVVTGRDGRASALRIGAAGDAGPIVLRP